MDLSSTAVVVDLEFSKDTKNTQVFSTDEQGAAVSQLYVSKEALAKIGNPKAVRITVEAAG